MVGKGVKVLVGVCVAVLVLVGAGVSVGAGVAVAVGVGVWNDKSCASGGLSCVKPTRLNTTATAVNKKGLRSAPRCCPRFCIFTAQDFSTKRARRKSRDALIYVK